MTQGNTAPAEEGEPLLAAAMAAHGGISLEAVPPWADGPRPAAVVEAAPPRADDVKAWEGLLAQGNGYLHLRGSFEEGLSEAPQNEEYLRLMQSVTTEEAHERLSKCGTYVPSIMGRHPSLGEVAINLPNPLALGITADGERLDMLDSHLDGYSRRLDLASGELRRTFTWHTASGAVIEVTFARFASAASRHLVVQRAELRVLSGRARLDLRAGIDADVTTNGYRHLHNLATLIHSTWLAVEAETDLGEQVTMAACAQLTSDGAIRPPDYAAEGSGVWLSWRVTVQPGSVLVLTKRTAIATSRDEEAISPHEAVTEALGATDGLTYEAMLDASRAVTAPRFAAAVTSLAGPPAVVATAYLAAYHLLRCTPAVEAEASICPKGYAGEAYYGRAFWDSEIYLLPFYLAVDPPAARRLLHYRYRTLAGARANARAGRCRGAKFAWQSGVDGTEQCGLWEYADNELHITADVAHAVMRYYSATSDWAFMAAEGAELLLETARFWLDRVDRDAAGVPHLLNTMGPDEYSPMTRDNAFTNWMVRRNCASAAAVARDYARRDPDGWAALTGRLGVDEVELAAIERLSTELPLPWNDAHTLLLESADFESFPEIDIDGLWTDRTRAFGFHASQDRIYRSRCIKQADVLALMDLFPDDFTDVQVEAAYRFHMPYTVHDSSLSPVVHASVAARLGRHEEAAAFLRAALAVDGDLARHGAADGVHIANLASIWRFSAALACKKENVR